MGSTDATTAVTVRFDTLNATTANRLVDRMQALADREPEPIDDLRMADYEARARHTTDMAKVWTDQFEALLETMDLVDAANEATTLTVFGIVRRALHNSEAPRSTGAFDRAVSLAKRAAESQFLDYFYVRI